MTDANRTDVAVGSGGYRGGIDVALPVSMAIAGFFAISLYNVVEINVQVFFTFHRHRSLYFWSLLAASWGIALHSVGFLMQFFQLCRDNYINVTIITLGGVPMVIGQSLVLYSRLHLIVDDARKVRWVLRGIVLSFFVFTVPPTVLNYGTNSSHPHAFAGPFRVYEKVMLFGFAAQEVGISCLYLWETRKMLRLLEPGMHEAPRRVMRHLIYVNILVILMDLSIIATELAGAHEIQTTWKSAAYSIKLKLEFPVLNRLCGLVTRGSRDACEWSSGDVSTPASPGRNSMFATRRHSSFGRPLVPDRQPSGPASARVYSLRVRPAEDVESCSPPRECFLTQIRQK